MTTIRKGTPRLIKCWKCNADTYLLLWDRKSGLWLCRECHNKEKTND